MFSSILLPADKIKSNVPITIDLDNESQHMESEW